MPLPTLNTDHINLGNILSTAESIKNSRVNRDTLNTQNILAAEKLREYRQNSGARKSSAEIASKLATANLSLKQLELSDKLIDSMTNELISIPVEKYPQFIHKWKQAGANVSNFPSPQEMGNDPDKFRAFQRQSLNSAKSVRTQIQEQIKQKGLKEREQIKQTSLYEREQLKQKGLSERKKIEIQNTKPTGDLAYFIAITGRAPKNAAEFRKFRINIKTDTGLTDEQKELKKSYFQAIGRANAAKRGEGQFVPDPNQQVVSEQEYERAEKLKEGFIAAGGKPSQLGLPDTSKIKTVVNIGDIYKNKQGKRIQWNGTKWIKLSTQ